MHPLIAQALAGATTSPVEIIDLRPGEPLTRAGESDTRLFVVMEGELSVVFDTGSPTKTTFHHGDVLGEIGFLTGASRTATVVANTDAKVAAIPEGGLGDEGDHNASLLQLALQRSRQALLYDVLTHRYRVSDPETLEAFENAAMIRSVPLSENLFADDERGVAIVLGGSFRVEDERGLVAHVGRGEILGELGWLLARPHVANVTAWRDSVVATFDVDEFERLVTAHPATLLELTRLIAQRLATDPIHRRSRPPRPMTVALVTAHPSLDPVEIGAALAAHLDSQTSVTLDASAVDAQFSHHRAAEAEAGSAQALAVANWLDSVEADHEIVLYIADHTWTNWTTTSVRRADRIMVAVDATQPPSVTDIERRIGASVARPDIDLLFVHPPRTELPSNTASWLAIRSAGRHDHVRVGHPGDHGRAARRLGGVPNGLVLGGGGARGFASIGVAQALEDHGWPFDVIGGTSMGALIGAGLAFSESAEWVVGMSRRNGYRRSLHDVTLPLASVFASRKVTTMLRREYGDVLIEDLWRPFFAIAANLSKAEETVIDRGPLWEAVRASIAIPGVFSPISMNGDLIVDGGIMNNLPIDIMRRRCEEGRVVAVNVSPRSTGGVWDLPPQLSGWRLLWSKVGPGRSGRRAPSIAGTVLRSMDTNSVARLQHHTHLADLVIQPDVKGFSILDWDSHQEIIEVGRMATMEALAREGIPHRVG